MLTVSQLGAEDEISQISFQICKLLGRDPWNLRCHMRLVWLPHRSCENMRNLSQIYAANIHRCPAGSQCKWKGPLLFFVFQNSIHLHKPIANHKLIVSTSGGCDCHALTALFGLTWRHFLTGTRPHSRFGTSLHCSSAICLQLGLATLRQLLTGMVWQSWPPPELSSAENTFPP